LDDFFSKEIGGDNAGDKHDGNGQQHTHAGNMHTEQRISAQARGQQQQRLIHGIDQELEHPEGDPQRDPDQQPGDEIFLHVARFNASGKRSTASGIAA
jgi:hypothetical protein